MEVAYNRSKRRLKQRQTTTLHIEKDVMKSVSKAEAKQHYFVERALKVATGTSLHFHLFGQERAGMVLSSAEKHRAFRVLRRCGDVARLRPADLLDLATG